MNDIVLKNVNRIGVREDGKTRPVRVVLADVADKSKVLKKLQVLKNSEEQADQDIFREVHLSSDNTRKQREEFKTAKDELEKRIQKGEKDLMIKNGKVVTKAPFRGRRGAERIT